MAESEVRPLGMLDTIMRKMTNNNNVIFKRRGSRIRLQLAVDRVLVKTNARLLACARIRLQLAVDRVLVKTNARLLAFVYVAL